MARLLLLLTSLVFAAASPVLAGEERATIKVSLKIEPFCAARSAPIPSASPDGAAPPVRLHCAADPKRLDGQERSPPYTVRTVRNATGTVVSFDF